MSDDYDPGEDPALDVLINRLPPETAERMRRWVAARRAEQREQGRLFHQQLTLVFGTLGAIAFAGLVLVLQDPKPFRLNGPKWLTPHQNFVVLVIILSIAIMLALFSCIATTFSAAGATKMLGPVGTFGYVGGLLSVVALLISMLLMVQDVSPRGSTIATIGAVVIALVFIVAIVAEVGSSTALHWFRIRRQPQ